MAVSLRRSYKPRESDLAAEGLGTLLSFEAGSFVGAKTACYNVAEGRSQL
jgi:hypothetical protein